MTTSLPSALSLGHVHLTVADLERSLAFYQDVLGLRLHRREGATAALGAGREDLLRLTARPEAVRPRRATGLYHFALLVPSRFELAQSLRRIAETQAPVQGFSDHLVSEALYLPDPDGNGIEVYRDRPRADWTDADGRFKMGTEPLDIAGVLGELGDRPPAWEGVAPDTVLGHMHLHVRDTREALAFYREVLGFDLMLDLGSALFISAGGYHHHLGLNVWGTLGAPPPPPNAIGLREFTLHLPTAADLAALQARAAAAGHPGEAHPLGWLVRDPSRNALVFTTAPAAGRGG